MSEHPLAGAMEKFNRSKEQFDELRRELEAFTTKDPQPHSIGEFDTEAWEWVERLQVPVEPPLRLGVIFGDALHNLRSCLDHVMWQVTLLDGGTPDNSTQYPIASKSEAQFESMANKQIPGLSAAHRAMVKKTQPYHAGNGAERHPLSVLANLSNIDKHQIVHPTHRFMVGDAGEALDRLIASYQGEGPSPVRRWWLARESSRMEHGTPWFSDRVPPN